MEALGLTAQLESQHTDIGTHSPARTDPTGDNSRGVIPIENITPCASWMGAGDNQKVPLLSAPIDWDSQN